VDIGILGEKEEKEKSSPIIKKKKKERHPKAVQLSKCSISSEMLKISRYSMIYGDICKTKMEIKVPKDEYES